jgi:cobalt/nickel transport system ATP-binding protein
MPQNEPYAVDEKPVYEFRDVSFAYKGNQVALDRVNLTVRSGESLAVLGANGSGKSTMLKLMDGLYFPTGGELLAFGKSFTEQALEDDAVNFDFRRRVGLLFQDSDVQLFSPTVFDEVAFAPLQTEWPREEVIRRVEAALHALRIDKLRDRPPHRLSGGEKRRVAMASLLSLDPAVWLLDEPSAGLDPRSQAWLEDFIIDQVRTGKTIIAATHDLSLAEVVASRICVFNEAHQLVADGTPADILSNQVLLSQCNLVHEHRHPHTGAGAEHSHPHIHHPSHEHIHPLK